ncbi:NAD(P)H-dependent oxidoreductase [Candidatus Parvarchaeota archaeon]|nr:NAD(P)H-dependent oxidoreductase [Candidatus Parvarchaeota archaeon]
MTGKITVLGFAGSLRRDSFNKAVLNTAKRHAPEGVEVEIFDLEGVPLYNQDEEKNMPAKVVEFKRKIEQADAVLIVTPEYNRSIPGVLKNAIDYASRPYGHNSFDDKPVATIGASGGEFIGTAVVQYHLRQVFSFLNMHPLERPQIFITNAEQKIKGGEVIDAHTIKLIEELLQRLAEWTLRLKKER